MAYYLSFDGVDDWLKAPSMTFTEIIADIVILTRTDSATTQSIVGYDFGSVREVAGTTGDLIFLDGTNPAVYVDGVQKTHGTDFLTPKNGTRITFRITQDAYTGQITVFRNGAGSGTALFGCGKLYDLKIYNGATLQAHYDCTLGNVNDQTANGRNGILTGGTWVDDGAGTTLTGNTSLQGVGTLTASGTSILSGSASLQGSGALTATGSTQINGSATLQGTGTLIATGSVSLGGQITGSANLQGTGALTATGVQTQVGSVTFLGAGTLTATGSKNGWNEVATIATSWQQDGSQPTTWRESTVTPTIWR